MKRLLSTAAMTCLALCAGLSVSPRIVAQTVTAEPSSRSNCLSISELIALSRVNSVDVKLAQARTSEAQANIEEARSLYRPQVSAFGRTGVGDTGIIDSGVSNQFGVRVSQRLYDFGQAKFTRDAADAGLLEQERLVEFQTDAAVLSTLESVLNYLQADAQSDLTQDRVAFFREQKQSTEALLQDGGATITEIANVSSRLAEAESFQDELRFARARALTQYQTDTQSSALYCSQSLDVEDLFPELSPLLSGAVLPGSVSRRNPFLRSLEARIENLEALDKRQKRSRFPVVQVVGTGSYASFNRFENFEFRDRVGIDVSVPLTGGTIVANERRATARLSIARADYARALRETEENIAITQKRILSLKQQYQHRLETERQMKLRFDSSIIEREAGTKRLQDLIEIRLDYEAAGLARINTEFEIQRQMLALLGLTGSSTTVP